MQGLTPLPLKKTTIEGSMPSNILAPQPQTNLAKKTFALSVGFKSSSEDNSSRKIKVRGFLKQFQAQIEAIHEKGGPLGLKEKLKEGSEPLFSTLDHIFSLYNINIQIIQQDQSDSALRIEPVVHVGKAIQCLAFISVILSRLPYSFVKLVDLNKFTVCKYMQLKSESHLSLYNTRIMTNAMFITDIHNTFDRVEKHFCKILLHHIQKRMPSIHNDWPEDKSPKKDSIQDARKSLISFKVTSKSPEKTSPTPRPSTMADSPSPVKIGGKKQKLSEEEQKIKEEYETLFKLIKDPHDVLENTAVKSQQRARFLKEKLEQIDPVGIDDEWWVNIKSSSFTVDEDMEGDFVLNSPSN